MEKNKNTKTELLSYGSASSSGLCFAVLLVVGLLLSLLLTSLLNIIAGDNAVVKTCALSVVSSVSLIAVCLFFTKGAKVSFKVSVSFNKFNPVFVLVSVIVAINMLFGFGFINILLANAFGKTSSTTVSNPTELILYLIFIALLPAITEEFCFRGVILNNLKYTGAIIASILCALSFALFHKSAFQFFYQFIFGLFLSVMAIKSGSVIPSVLAHFFNNAIILIFEYFRVNINLLDLKYILIGVILLAIVSVYLFYGINSNVKKDGEVKKFFIPFGLFAYFVCILFIVLSMVL